MISVLDVLAVEPGHLDEVRGRVRDELRPRMEGLDMHLVRTWMSPAVELVDRPTELLCLWDLADVAAFWRMRTAAARDPATLAFWREVGPMITRRERKLLCDPDDDMVLR